MGGKYWIEKANKCHAGNKWNTIIESQKWLKQWNEFWKKLYSLKFSKNIVNEKYIKIKAINNVMKFIF